MKRLNHAMKSLEIVLWYAGVWNIQGLLFPYSCPASHSCFSYYWGFKNHSCSNSWLPTWFLQLFPGWYFRFKSDSPSACPEYSCSNCRTKTSVLPHHTCPFRFALASGSLTELVSKLLRLLSECSNFSSHPIFHLSSQDMYRREHSALNSLSFSICVPPRKITMAASKSFSSVASNIWNAFIYLFAEEQISNLYNHTVYKDVLIQQDLEGREHLI